MRRFAALSTITISLAACSTMSSTSSSGASASASSSAMQASPEYKVVQRARVGGEGGTDYIYADVVGRRLYIPRGGTRAVAKTDSSAKEAVG